MAAPSKDFLHARPAPADSAPTASAEHCEGPFSQEMRMQSKSPTGGIDPKPNTKETDTKNKETPSPEMQMEDAGTPASGNSGLGGRESASEGELKPSGGDGQRNSGE